eukprot:173051_1
MSEPLQMVRNGVSLGLDMTPKFLWAACGFMASLKSFQKTNKLEYFMIYGFAGSFWTWMESRLLTARKATKHNPKLFKIISLSPLITTIIRGFAEGGAFTILGIMLGDKLYSDNWLKSMLILLFGTQFISSPYLHECSPTTNKNVRISSVRQIFKGNAGKYIAFWTIIYLIGLKKLRKENCTRLKQSFIALCVVGLLWNWFGYLNKTRWISRDKTGKTVASFYDQLIGLNYDAIFEIAAIYCGFISICMMVIEQFTDKNDKNDIEEP